MSAARPPRALAWLRAHADELGLDQDRIAIGGASAAKPPPAALGLLTRDRAAIPLAFQLPIYPMLDDRTVTAADSHPYTGESVWTHDTNRPGWTSLLGQEAGGANDLPDAAARATDLAGLPQRSSASARLTTSWKKIWSMPGD